MPTTAPQTLKVSHLSFQFNETRLIDRAQAGDHSAFTQLLKANDRNMRGLAYSLVGSQAAMDDSLQDAYLKAYRNLESFRQDSQFSTWLYRIVYRACLDYLKKQGRRQEVSLQLVPDSPDTSAQIDAQVASADQLQRALAQLTPDHRAAILLVDGEGLSYDEAAQVLDVGVGTVASRLNRAREALRAAITNSEIDLEDNQ